MKNGYVYVFDFWNRIKIWRSTNVESRKRWLETSSWCHVIQTYYKEFEDTIFVENKMHKIFYKYRWLWEYFFNISFEKIVNELKNISNKKLNWKYWYDNLSKNDKIIYLLKSCVEDKNLIEAEIYWQCYFCPKVLRVIKENWQIEEKVVNLDKYTNKDIKELEKISKEINHEKKYYYKKMK